MLGLLFSCVVGYMAFFVSLPFGIETRDFNHTLWYSLFLVVYSLFLISTDSLGSSIISLVQLGFVVSLRFSLLSCVAPVIMDIRSYGELWRMLVVFIVLHWSLSIYSVTRGFLGDCLVSGTQDSWSSSLISLGVLSFGLACSVPGSLWGFCVYGPLHQVGY